MATSLQCDIYANKVVVKMEAPALLARALAWNLYYLRLVVTVTLRIAMPCA